MRKINVLGAAGVAFLLTVLGCARQMGKDATRGALDELQRPESGAKTAAADVAEDVVAGAIHGAAQPSPARAPSGEAPEIRQREPSAVPVSSPVHAADAAAPRPRRSVLQNDLTRIAGGVTRSATREAIAEIETGVAARIQADLAHDGPLSQAIAAASAAATRGMLDASLGQARAVVGEACPGGITLRDCLRQEIRAASSEVSGGIVDEHKWPLRLLIGSAIAFLFTGALVMGTTFVRMVGGHHGGLPATGSRDATSTQPLAHGKA